MPNTHTHTHMCTCTQYTYTYVYTHVHNKYTCVVYMHIHACAYIYTCTYCGLGNILKDNLVVKFIHCVIFLWVSYTHKISYPRILFTLSNLYLCKTYAI